MWEGASRAPPCRQRPLRPLCTPAPPPREVCSAFSMTVSKAARHPDTCSSPSAHVSSAVSVLSFENPCVHIFHPVCEMFGNYFSKHFSCSIFLPELQLRIPDSLYCPQSCAFYFQSPSFLFFRLRTSCGPVFGFAASFFCHLQSAAKPTVDWNEASALFRAGTPLDCHRDYRQRQLVVSPGPNLSTAILPTYANIFAFSKLDDLILLLNSSCLFN